MKAIEKLNELGINIDKDIEAIYKSDWHISPDLQTLQYTREQLKNIVRELESLETYLVECIEFYKSDKKSWEQTFCQVILDKIRSNQ